MDKVSGYYTNAVNRSINHQSQIEEVGKSIKRTIDNNRYLNDIRANKLRLDSMVEQIVKKNKSLKN